jgi:hypothetical protein
MKNIVMFVMFLLIFCSYSVDASIYCLDNSQHLAEDFDDKEWHTVACNCPCTIVKGYKCVECGHLQNASTYVVVQPAKVAQQKKISVPNNPMAVLRKITARYLQKKR